MPRVLLTLEYDGTRYAGWQVQAGLTTVAAELGLAIARVTGEPLATQQLLVAGRTDRGVHARGQRATFDTASLREAKRFAPALNHVLPLDIRVHRAEHVAPDFSVRRAARGKWYRYTVLQAPPRSALYGSRAWLVRRHLNFARATAAAQALVGERDFEAFRSVHCDAAHARRRIDVARWLSEPISPIGTLWHLDLVGNAFCRHMCRIIAGTLVDIAGGQLPPSVVADALASRRRIDAGQTAPAAGLTLMDVAYPAAQPDLGGGIASDAGAGAGAEAGAGADTNADTGAGFGTGTSTSWQVGWPERLPVG